MATANTVNVSKLFVYPVKSLRGIPLSSAKLLATGFEYDRHWMLINPKGRFLTQRQFPQMVLIRTRLEADHVVLSKNGMSDLYISLTSNENKQSFEATVWKDQCQVIDEGEDASQWLTEAIATPKPVRLVRMAESFHRPQSKPERLGEETHTLFADAAPYLIANEQSLIVLNQHLEKNGIEAVSIERFRPNIVVDGLQAFSEHKINGLKHKHYQLKHCYPCQRCVVPTIDIDTGIRHPQQQPFSLVAELNSMPDNPKAPAFGENAIITAGEGSLIHIGDELLGNSGEHEVIN